MTDCLSFKEGGYTASFMMEPDHQWRRSLQRYAERVLKALPGPQTFSFHLEVFVNVKGEMTFLEIACRTGGARVNSVIGQTFGFNLNRAFVRAQLS